LITCDYPGYGFSTGSCSESSMNDAAVTLLDFALSHLNHKMNEIFIIGKSLGSTPAIYTASQAVCYDLAGIVLIAPIASGVRCLSGSNNIPEFILNRLDQLVLPNITRIKDVCCPIQFIHGEQDNVVPVSNTRALMVALHSHCMTKPLFLDCSHNDIESKFSLEFTNTIETFMQKCDGLRVHRGYDVDSTRKPAVASRQANGVCHMSRLKLIDNTMTFDPMPGAVYSAQMCSHTTNTELTCSMLAQNMSSPADSSTHLHKFPVNQRSQAARSLSQIHPHKTRCTSCHKANLTQVLTRLMQSVPISSKAREQLSFGQPQRLHCVIVSYYHL
jgi:hypothetical protein